LGIIAGEDFYFYFECRAKKRREKSTSMIISGRISADGQQGRPSRCCHLAGNIFKAGMLESSAAVMQMCV
jgi:ribosomal 50S subunit-recycling heat shock protein